MRTRRVEVEIGGIRKLRDRFDSMAWEGNQFHTNIPRE
jgi:hypothetical protein